MCELVVFDGHFPSTTAYGMQKRETGIKQLNDIKGTSSTEIPVVSDWLRSKNFRGLLLTDQVKLLRSQWIETLLICLFGWDLACSSRLVDGKSTF